VNNLYGWTRTGVAEQGNVYTDVLARLNAGSGFANLTGWRLPIISELQSILVGPGVDNASAVDPADPAMGTNPTGQALTCSGSPCIDPTFATIGGPTAASGPYWSASRNINDPNQAWYATFSNGFVGLSNGPSAFLARAVRAGSCFVDSDGDGISDLADTDDDNDRLLDAFEVSNGFDPLTPGEQNLDSDLGGPDGLNNLEEQAAGTKPLVADTDGDGLSDGEEVKSPPFTNPLSEDSDGDRIGDAEDQDPLDGSNCRVTNPQVYLVWDVDAPFGLKHEKGPTGRHRYLRRESKDEVDEQGGFLLPGLKSEGLHPARLETVRGKLETLLNFLPTGLDDNGAHLSVTNCFEGSCDLAQGRGSAALIYLSDRSQLPNDPDLDSDFGLLGGVAWDGVNRFSRTCRGGRAAVLVTAVERSILQVPGSPDLLDPLVEKIAHEVGHLYGLRHVLTDDPPTCVGPLLNPAVMDYLADGALNYADCMSPGCLVVEPPECDTSGQATGGTHNPLYHFLRYPLGYSAPDLALLSPPLLPGSWDQEAEPIRLWKIEFTFTCLFCDNPADVSFYNVTFYELLDGETAVPIALNAAGDTTFEVISLADLNALQFLLPSSSSLELAFSSGDPSAGGPAEENITFAAPIRPPEDESVLIIAAQLVKVDQTGTQTFENISPAAQPVYEIRKDGIYDLDTDGDGNPLTLNGESSGTPPVPELISPGRDVPRAVATAVPEPAGFLPLLAGIAALWVLRRRRGARKGSHRLLRGVGLSLCVAVFSDPATAQETGAATDW
ncbi:MAG TPA: DUF1566 domain-containing protein, partial [Gemmatimonadetes bacterium]|nr:DUF1566 domain-containing protein [Gemmatimonadota bacterium]